MVRTSMDTEVEVDPINTKTNVVAIRNHQNILTLITKKTCFIYLGKPSTPAAKPKPGCSPEGNSDDFSLISMKMRFYLATQSKIACKYLKNTFSYRMWVML